MSRLLRCLDCTNSQNYSTKDDLEAHIAFAHLKLTAYQCEFCEFAKFPTEYTVAKHCAELHGLDECKVIFNYSAQNKASQAILAEKLRLCVDASENFPVVKMEDTAMAQQMAIDAQYSVKAETSQITPRSQDVTSNTVTVKREAPESPVEPSANRRGSLRGRQDQGSSGNQNNGQLPEPSTSAASSALIVPDVQVEVVIPLPVNTENVILSDDEEELECTSSQSATKVQCALCSVVVSSNMANMTYHASVKHGSLVLFECGYCDRKWNSCQLSQIKKHIRNNHRKDDGKVNEDNYIDHREKLQDELKELRDKCFPRK